MFDVDELAQEIRRLDGAHSLAAGALAEALMPYLADRQAREEARDGGGWEQARAEERAKCVADIDYVIANIIPTPSHRVRFSQRDLEQAFRAGCRVARDRITGTDEGEWKKASPPAIEPSPVEGDRR